MHGANLPILSNLDVKQLHKAGTVVIIITAPVGALNHFVYCFCFISCNHHTNHLRKGIVMILVLLHDQPLAESLAHSECRRSPC